MPEKYSPEAFHSTKITIPNEDVRGWIDIFMEAGYSQDEIDAVLSRANATYFLKKHPQYAGELGRQMLKEAHDELLSRNMHLSQPSPQEVWDLFLEAARLWEHDHPKGSAAADKEDDV